MKSRLLLCAGLILVLALPATSPEAWAKSKKKKKQEFVPSPTPTPPGPPSGDLTNFVSTHGDKIFALLDQRVVMPRAELAQLRNGFAQRFTRASLGERNQFQASLTVCDALGQVMTERDKAVMISSREWPARAAQLRQYIDQLIAKEQAMEARTISPTTSPTH